MSPAGDRARRPSRAPLVVVLLLAALGFYVVLLGARGLSLLGDPRLVVKGLGLGVLLLPVVGVAVAVQEVRFGRDSQRLGARLEAEGERPEAAPADRTEADAAFATRRAETEAAPDSWRAWYRLGVAYAAAGDIGRGRRAVRRAIALERAGLSAGDGPRRRRRPSSTER